MDIRLAMANLDKGVADTFVIILTLLWHIVGFPSQPIGDS